MVKSWTAQKTHSVTVISYALLVTQQYLQENIAPTQQSVR